MVADESKKSKPRLRMLCRIALTSLALSFLAHPARAARPLTI